MATQRKKYNPRKHSQLLDNKLLENIMIIFVGGIRTSVIYLKNENRILKKIPQHIVDLIIKRKHMWTVLCSSICRDHSNKEYIKSSEIITKIPCYQTDFEEELNRLHTELVFKETNPQQLINISWIAVPYDHEFNDQATCFNLYQSLGAFEFMAPWETPTMTLDQELRYYLSSVL